MRRLHLLPVPAAQVIPFPAGARENPEAVVAQLRNVLAVMSQTNGAYLGRAYFAEAAVWVIAQAASEADDIAATRDAMLDDFETALRFKGVPPGFSTAALPDGAA